MGKPAREGESPVWENKEGQAAKVVVPDYQLSLAIGKEGQNARLAARLTGFKIDIKSETQARESGDFLDYENDYEDDEYDDNYEYDEEGYVCDLCENQYGQQYSNVLACNSRQVVLL